MDEKPENTLDPDDAWFMRYSRRVVRLHIRRRKECERRMLNVLEVAQQTVIWSLVIYAAACGICLGMAVSIGMGTHVSRRSGELVV